MRPLRLEMTGFGAYAGRQELCFDQLGRQALFLIHGPTGAGKTTVLDAICFALYGESSGGERDGRQMRSHHAGLDTPTEVVLDFALGDAAYRVRRNPDYERQGRRGGKPVAERHGATLWRLDRVGELWCEGTVLATKASAATEAVRGILGFDAQQFRQVVILPQGQFRKLLSSNSDEREKILAVLFATERFAQLQELMREQAAELRRQAEAVGERRQDLLDQAETGSLEALRERLDGFRAEEVVAEGRLLELRAVADRARVASEAGRETHKVLGELAAATAEVTRLEAAARADVARAERLRRARQAAGIVGERTALDEAERRVAAARSAGEQARAALAQAVGRQAEAVRRCADEQARAPERDQARREAERLAALEVEVAAAYRLQAQQAQAVRTAAQAEAALLARTRGQEAAAKALERALAAADAGRMAAQRLAGLEALVKERTQTVNRRRQLALTEGGLGEQERAAARLKARQAEALRKLDTMRRELDQLERAFRHGAAAVLAAGLVAGEPCPVCGGRDHPAPASTAEPIPGEAILDSARATVADAEQRAGEQAAELVRAEERLAAALARAGEERAALGAAADVALAGLEAEGAEARHELEAARGQAAGLAAAEEALTAARRQAETLRAECHGAAVQAQEARNAAAAAEAAAHGAVERLPPALRGAKDAADAERRRRGLHVDAQAKYEQLAATLSAAQARAQEATAEESAARARLESEEGAKSAAETECQAAAVAFGRALQVAGFADRAAYEAAALSPDAMAELDRTLQAAREARSGAAAWLGRAQAQSAGLTAPDLDALSAAEQAAALAVEEARDAQATRRLAIEQLDRVQQQLVALNARYQELDGRHKALGRLAEVANGRAGGYKVTFQRFVLGALLDEVLDAASQRLRVMSDGRYVLRRLDPEQSGGHRGAAAGLDLEVDDAWTGKARHVATLSGGEGFLAALALALGLADVVQARAGGRRLDTIFIDEGFGALDGEALDLALKILTDLQRNGRLVGLISHVPELKERIDVRLEVAKGEQGSRAQFRLG